MTNVVGLNSATLWLWDCQTTMSNLPFLVWDLFFITFKPFRNAFTPELNKQRSIGCETVYIHLLLSCYILFISTNTFKFCSYLCHAVKPKLVKQNDKSRCSQCFLLPL